MKIKNRPPGYRKLRNGEKIKKGDLCLGTAFSTFIPDWHKGFESHGDMDGQGINKIKPGYIYFRKI